MTDEQTGPGASDGELPVRNAPAAHPDQIKQDQMNAMTHDAVVMTEAYPFGERLAKLEQLKYLVGKETPRAAVTGSEEDQQIAQCAANLQERHPNLTIWQKKAAIGYAMFMLQTHQHSMDQMNMQVARASELEANRPPPPVDNGNMGMGPDSQPEEHDVHPENGPRTEDSGTTDDSEPQEETETEEAFPSG